MRGCAGRCLVSSGARRLEGESRAEGLRRSATALASPLQGTHRQQAPLYPSPGVINPSPGEPHVSAGDGNTWLSLASCESVSGCLSTFSPGSSVTTGTASMEQGHSPCPAEPAITDIPTEIKTAGQGVRALP